MKTLKALWLQLLIGFVAILIMPSTAVAQCTVNAGADLAKCYGQIVNMGVGVVAGGISPFQYSWNGGASWSASPNYSITANTSGTYTVIVKDATNCQISDQIYLNVLPLPIADAGPDVAICPGATTALCGTASSTNGPITSMTWIPSFANTACTNVTPSSTTNYIFSVTDASNCQATNSVQVVVYASITVNAGADQTMCLSTGTVQLTGTSSSGAPNSGTWSGPGVNATGLFTATAVGSYTLTYSRVSAQGCTFNDNLVMTVTNPSPPNGGPDLVKCVGSPAFNLPATGTWSGSTFVNSGGTFNPSTVGIYNLTVSSSSGGCTTIDNVQVSVVNLPSVNAGLDQNICTGQSAQLNGTASSGNGGITNIAWSGGWMSSTSVLNPTATPPSTTTYTLYVTDAANCMASDDVVITVNPYPVANAGNDTTICSNSLPTQLLGFSPAGGTWSGTSVDASGLFTPSSVGSFTLTYSYTTAAGCSDTDTRIVNVIAPNVINAGADQTLCLNAPALQLLAGGTWTGSTYVTSGGLFTPSAVNTYTLTYTTTSGQCQSSDQIVVDVKELPTVDAGADQTICNGQTATLTATASSPNGSITTYAWSGSTAVASSGSASTTTAPTATTTYTMQVTDNVGCTANDNVVVTVNTVPTVNAGNDITVCSNSSAFVLSGATPSGGTWSGSGVNGSGLFTPSVAGIFTLSYAVTNAQGCTTIDTRDITVITPNVINAGADQTLCLNSAQVQLLGGGTWSGSYVTSGGLFTPSNVGDYTLTYTTTSGQCQSSDQIIVSVKALPTVNAGADQAICNGQTATLTATALSTNGSITTYAWSGSTIVASPSSASTTTAPTVSTTYTMQVTDNDGCTASDNIVITVNTVPTVNAGNDITVCSNSSPTQLTGFTPAGGTWSGSGVNASGMFTPGTVGTYTLTYTFTSAQGCTATDIMDVTVIAPNVINAGADQTLCLNTTPVQLLGGGTWTGSYVTSGGLFTPSNAGDYTLTYTTTSGQCQSSDQIVVSVKALPTVNAGADQAICNGQTATLTATAASTNGIITTYAWSGSTIVASPSSASTTTAPTVSTTYTMQVTDNDGCTASDIIVITVNTVPTVNAGNDVTVCSNASPTQLTGFTPAGGTWSGSGVNASGMFTPGTVGTYTLAYTFTSAQGCTASDIMDVTVIAPNVINAGADQTLCLNTTPVQLLGGGTWTGSYVTSGGLFTPSNVGDFTLTYTTTSGQCQSSDQIIVSVKALPTVNAGADQAICNGQTATLTATASSTNGSITTYAWSGSTAVVSPGSASTTTAPTATTTYTMQVTDNVGCTASDNILITVNTVPTVNAGSDVTVCSNASPTQLTGFTPAGGTWSGSGVNATGLFTPGTVGTYTLTYTFTSAQGCTATDIMDVTVIAPNVINAGADQTLCLNTTPVQLLGGGTWSGSYVTSGGLFTPSNVGDYTLTYTTTSGQCQSSDQIIVSVKALPTVNAGADQAICNGQTATLTATAVSTNGSITTYAWSGSTAVVSSGSASTTTAPIANTTYTMQVTDNVGCTASDIIVVTVNALPTVNAGNDITLCNQPIAHQLNGFTPAGGTWSGTNVTPSGVYTPNGVGTFTLTYCSTNGNGCSACDNIVVTVNATTMANAGADENVCVGSPAFMLTPGNAGGTWTSTPFLTAAGMFTPSVAATYNCTYTLGSGTCLTTDIKTVFIRALPIINAGNDASICAGNSHNINASVGASGGPFTYAWSNSATLSANNTEDVIATPNATTTYAFTVTNTYNCVSTDNITITVVPLAVPSFNAIDTSCVSTNVNMVNTSTGATSYSWSLGNSNSSSAINPTTTYPTTGVFNITLTANNSLGCSTTTSQPITILATPTAHFSLTTNEGCSPLLVGFVNQSTGQNMSYSWNLDGATSTNANPSPETYTAQIIAGEYNISLTTSNICGSNTYSEVVTVNPPPRALFNTSLSSQCSPVTTNFINMSDGYPDSFAWNLGNGETNTTETPDAEVYVTDASSEDYTITLYAFNECGVDSTQSVLTVLPNTVNMNLMPSITYGCSPMFVEFNNSTTGATNHYYDFGDTSNSSIVSPSHIYSNPGVYNLVYYANDGCSFDTTYMTIEVIPSPTIQITSSSTASCPLVNVGFDSQTTGDISSVNWNFGDDTSASGTNVMHEYAVGNTYYVSATAVATNGCEASASMEYLVHPKPVASMSASPAQACSPVMVCTNNTSTGATQQLWSFGISSQSTELNPCHGFNNSSNEPIAYLIALEVENQFGCTDTTSQMIEVLPQPITSFELSSYENCAPLETVNVNISTQGSTDYQWTVNGTDYSNEMTPSFSFNEIGSYAIQVVSMNDYGCTDMHEEVYTIHPLPVINIVASPTSGCIPLEVDFVNNTTNGDTYLWTFGTGAQSTLFEPTQTFIQEGVYDVQVEATSIHGCQSIRFYNDLIEAFGRPIADFSFTPNGDIIYELDVEFEDNSQGAISYSWDFGDGYVSDEPSPTHHYRTGGGFYATQTVTNEHGCTAEHTELVNIDDTYYIFVPNSFTPNDDGLNDLFIPVMSDKSFIKKYEFAIMNRWGETVFYTTDPEEGWIGNTRDGTYYNHNDTFNYMVKVEFDDLRISQMHTGSVTIIR